MEEKGVSPPMDESKWAEELENVDAPKRERHIKMISFLLFSKVSWSHSNASGLLYWAAE